MITSEYSPNLIPLKEWRSQGERGREGGRSHVVNSMLQEIPHVLDR